MSFKGLADKYTPRPAPRQAKKYITFLTIIRAINKATGIPIRDCRTVGQGFIKELKEALARGETVHLNTFGMLYTRFRKGYPTQIKGRKIVQPDTLVVKFKAALEYRQHLHRKPNPPIAETNQPTP